MLYKFLVDLDALTVEIFNHNLNLIMHFIIFLTWQFLTYS